MSQTGNLLQIGAKIIKKNTHTDQFTPDKPKQFDKRLTWMPHCGKPLKEIIVRAPTNRSADLRTILWLNLLGLWFEG